MKILILSFYYAPDLSAGSFRSSALVAALLDKMPDDAQIEVITTLPNRYNSFSSEAPKIEEFPRLTVRRIKLPEHHSGMIDQAKAFISYARQVLSLVRKGDYDLVYGTSSRLMTAVLSAYIANKKKVPLYLDIRDIFVDTIKDVLPKKIAFVAKPLFSLIERWTICQAVQVNLVSGGFRDYFQSRYPDQYFSFFTNGIDFEFIGTVPIHSSKEGKGPLRILYAGNMGEGQGLHEIVPKLANRLNHSAMFRLIGDGGRKAELERRLVEVSCKNVEVLNPITRDQLLVEYQNADMLFLHLNDYDAFRKVLPSKLFEYAATGKPILAGVSGYAADFVQSEIEGATVFSPCNVLEAEQAFSSISKNNVDRSKFIKKYSRTNIMKLMVVDILSKANKGT